MKKNSIWKHATWSLVTGTSIALILLFCFYQSSESKAQIILEEPMIDDFSVAKAISTPTPAPEFQKVRCKITAYCIEDYPHRCNNGDASTTATGTKPTPGRTVAVDPKVIPYFSNVIINGNTYIAEDTGTNIKGNRVDIVFATHQEALDFGVQYAEVNWVK